MSNIRTELTFRSSGNSTNSESIGEGRRSKVGRGLQPRCAGVMRHGSMDRA